MSASLTGSLTSGAPARKSRFTPDGKAIPTRSPGADPVEGRIGKGADNGGLAHLVHTVGHQVTGLPLYAIAQAFPLLGADDIAEACANLGMLDKLAQAVERQVAIAAAKK